MVWGRRKGDPCSEYWWAMRGRAMTPHCPGNRKNHDPPPAQLLHRPPPRLGLWRFCPIGNGLYQPDICRKVKYLTWIFLYPRFLSICHYYPIEFLRTNYGRQFQERLNSLSLPSFLKNLLLPGRDTVKAGLKYITEGVNSTAALLSYENKLRLPHYQITIGSAEQTKTLANTS